MIIDNLEDYRLELIKYIIRSSCTLDIEDRMSEYSIRQLEEELKDKSGFNYEELTGNKVNLK